MNRLQPSKSGLVAKISKLEMELEKLSRSVATTPKLDLELGMRDFGPIRDGLIRLRPLTIFIGPNNSGKSYAALLVRSAISLLGGRPSGAVGGSNRSIYTSAGDYNQRRNRPQLKAGNKRNEFLVTRSTLGALSRDAAGAITAAFSGQIEKNFSVHPSSLVRSGKACASIKIPGIIEISIPRNKKDRPVPLRCAMDVARTREALTDENIDGVKVKAMDGSVLACTFSTDTNAGVDAKSAYDRLLSVVLIAALNGHGHATPAATCYLPAARSGIMEAYKTILASVARSHADGWGDSYAVPDMKAVDYEFLAAVLEMGGKGGQFSRIANELERDALHGKIALRRAANGVAPDIYYARQREMPIRLASSAVSELAPLVLFLRHVVKRGDLLIVEEPESHMHPKNQVVLAKCIVRLVRAGLNIVVTTHSTHMMERFSAYLRAGQMTAGQRSRVGIEKGLYLDAGDIAPYLFEMSGNKTTVKLIDHSPHEGISQEEFIKVGEALHEENIRVDKIVG